MNLHAPTAKVTPRPVSAVAVKAMLGDGTELALVDVREELTFSQNHLLWARNVPLSRLELRFARLVPRKSTRIVLCDDNDGCCGTRRDHSCRRRIHATSLISTAA